jgi:small conductance mechanosensitive channel
MHWILMGSSEDRLNDKTNRDRDEYAKFHNESVRKVSISKLLATFIIAIAIVIIIEILIGYQLQDRYKTFLRIAEVGVIGYFGINFISNTLYKYTYDSLDKNAEAVKILIRILGTVIIIAIIISYLSHDPLVAAYVGTVTALIIGFASQNILGNIIAGLYVAITRPFRIGDKITVFGNTGIVFDIGLLNSRLKTETGDTVIAPNSSILGTSIVIRS